MGSLKKFLYKPFKRSLKKGLEKPDTMKRIVMAMVAVTALLMSGLVMTALFLYSVVKEFASQRPDLDLMAIESLIEQGTLVLEEEQIAAMKDLAARLSKDGLSTLERQELKERLLGLLSPDQKEAVQQWKSELLQKASKLSGLRKTIWNIIEAYTGITPQDLQQWRDAFMAWWHTRRPANSAEELERRLESI